jgi:chemotaxis protein MotB
MRRKRRAAEEPISHDRWMVSYADFITVLFAFFVVLFATLNQDNHTISRVSRAIHHGFQDLGSFSGGEGDGEATHQDLERDASAYPLTIQSAKTQKSDATEATGVDIAELRRQLELAIGKELRNGEVTIRVTPEGFVISLKELGFFRSGQAVLQPGAAEKIERIAKVLSEHGFNLRVEGYSDNQPIHTALFRSNWELSTARAMAVLVLLVDHSALNPSHISLAGYGEQRPIADNATAEGRKMNRRVDLVVVAGVLPDHRIH